LLWLSLAVGLSLFASAGAQETAPAPTVITGGNAGRAFSLGSSPNAIIVKAIESMPSGGGYRASGPAITALRGSMRASDGGIALEPAQATPSFCSGATYLVFLAALNELQRDKQISMSDATVRALLVEGQSDGTGVWGRWNANGPGTARLFFESGLGRNFTSFDEARPGDFMKVWWNDQIGALERGHSVVYLGQETRSDGPYVHYWSSNIPGGFGHAYVARQKMRRVLFSRLEHPEQINRVATLPAKDSYLASMLSKPSTPEQMAVVVGLPAKESWHLFPAPPTAATPVPAPAVRPSTRLPATDKSPAPVGTAQSTSATPLPTSPTPKKSWLGNLLHRQ
ncbi:MAG TPA: hypothetical protein VK961_27085, partial [Chthoniobacter sp.]|nr:hypothetical protein [Chthoniobacter sp.]